MKVGFVYKWHLACILHWGWQMAYIEAFSQFKRWHKFDVILALAPQGKKCNSTKFHDSLL